MHYCEICGHIVKKYAAFCTHCAAPAPIVIYDANTPFDTDSGRLKEVARFLIQVNGKRAFIIDKILN